ncbi:hypothetical protein FOPG_20149 [Fusarium oxysporum f. sp. conglutinans race 2 54008]|uniref:Uncharacterized protein n=1 Tax=Fusarium oxysporum f. sp. conglutinans race 2 54008 TaxID=1089457 RepID=X0GIV1_FUSOX|nr:hypothetical protein FOPG_20149 [Fusarium oxysporum f. sp. conglutinans race 2 54008]
MPVIKSRCGVAELVREIIQRAACLGSFILPPLRRSMGPLSLCTKNRQPSGVGRTPPLGGDARRLRLRSLPPRRPSPFTPVLAVPSPGLQRSIGCAPIVGCAMQASAAKMTNE